ncbi:hypothetical protein TRFO_32842 [Tritrichomonas foetus]|uniref:Uncharacterized protein n=1 Tax=Tritrichomonas foetus TaxID=1144522 RepID=A0A1J4JT82_9EUKA|nr:hypothetical protein TRFO_32842 [Tritrichomonas foetus]|eukprot:OHT00477.1 hypothetical protein TRFO_32842 [Tritrichomonas foetus]
MFDLSFINDNNGRCIVFSRDNQKSVVVWFSRFDHPSFQNIDGYDVFANKEEALASFSNPKVIDKRTGFLLGVSSDSYIIANKVKTIEFDNKTIYKAESLEAVKIHDGPAYVPNLNEKSFYFSYELNLTSVLKETINSEYLWFFNKTKGTIESNLSKYSIFPYIILGVIEYHNFKNKIYDLEMIFIARYAERCVDSTDGLREDSLTIRNQKEIEIAISSIVTNDKFEKELTSFIFTTGAAPYNVKPEIPRLNINKTPEFFCKLRDVLLNNNMNNNLNDSLSESFNNYLADDLEDGLKHEMKEDSKEDLSVNFMIYWIHIFDNNNKELECSTILRKAQQYMESSLEFRERLELFSINLQQCSFQQNFNDITMDKIYSLLIENDDNKLKENKLIGILKNNIKIVPTRILIAGNQKVVSSQQNRIFFISSFNGTSLINLVSKGLFAKFFQSYYPNIELPFEKIKKFFSFPSNMNNFVLSSIFNRRRCVSLSPSAQVVSPKNFNQNILGIKRNDIEINKSSETLVICLSEICMISYIIFQAPYTKNQENINISIFGGITINQMIPIIEKAYLYKTKPNQNHQDSKIKFNYVEESNKDIQKNDPENKSSHKKTLNHKDLTDSEEQRIIYNFNDYMKYRFIMIKFSSSSPKFVISNIYIISDNFKLHYFISADLKERHLVDDSNIYTKSSITKIEKIRKVFPTFPRSTKEFPNMIPFAVMSGPLELVHTLILNNRYRNNINNTSECTEFQCDENMLFLQIVTLNNYCVRTIEISSSVILRIEIMYSCNLLDEGSNDEHTVSFEVVPSKCIIPLSKEISSRILTLKIIGKEKIKISNIRLYSQ